MARASFVSDLGVWVLVGRVPSDDRPVDRAAQPPGNQAVPAADQDISHKLGRGGESQPSEFGLQAQLRTQQGLAAATLEGRRADPVPDQRLGHVHRAGAARQHPREQRVVLHQRQVAVAARGQHGAAPVDDGRVVERVVHPGVGLDLGRVGGRHPLADDVVGVPHELQQARPDDVGLGDQRDLHREALRHGHVVGVHPGHHVVLAGRQPGVQRGPQAAVVLQRHEGHRHRAALGQLLQAGGQLLAHRPVPDYHHLVRGAPSGRRPRCGMRAAGNPGGRPRRPKAAARRARAYAEVAFHHSGVRGGRRGARRDKIDNCRGAYGTEEYQGSVDRSFNRKLSVSCTGAD